LEAIFTIEAMGRDHCVVHCIAHLFRPSFRIVLAQKNVKQIFKNSERISPRRKLSWMNSDNILLTRMILKDHTLLILLMLAVRNSFKPRELHFVMSSSCYKCIIP
jgi:hypothetical protein